MLRRVRESTADEFDHRVLKQSLYASILTTGLKGQGLSRWDLRNTNRNIFSKESAGKQLFSQGYSLGFVFCEPCVLSYSVHTQLVAHPAQTFLTAPSTSTA